jgi:DNA-binding transcriptional ArsR family regulator
VDLAFLLRAFCQGADGVIIGGCWPGECHYVTEGNYDALGNVCICKQLLQRIGLYPERVRLEWIAASEGNRFAEVMSDFAEQLHQLGPLGQGEGIAEGTVEIRLAAAAQLVPYLKLVEREKLRVPTKSEEAYREFYSSDEVTGIFDGVIAEKLAISQLLLLLGERPRSTAEISDELGLSPSEVSRHLKSSSRHGLVRYDVEQQLFARA